jgi:hypothetical protein
MTNNTWIKLWNQMFPGWFYASLHRKSVEMTKIFKSTSQKRFCKYWMYNAQFSNFPKMQEQIETQAEKVTWHQAFIPAHDNDDNHIFLIAVTITTFKEPKSMMLPSEMVIRSYSNYSFLPQLSIIKLLHYHKQCTCNTRVEWSTLQAPIWCYSL